MKINEAFGEIQASFIDWGGFFKDPNYARTKHAISWSDPNDLIIRETIEIEHLHDLSNRRQFSFRVSADESLVQLGYRFKQNGDLAEARLGFYKFPDQAAPHDLTVEPPPQDADQRAISWLRLDFSATALIRVGHTPCHIHMSGLPTVRFSVYGVPSPAQFVEFVVSHFYPKDYREARLSGDGLFDTYNKIDTINSKATGIGTEPSQLLRCLPHFAIPGN